MAGSNRGTVHKLKLKAPFIFNGQVIKNAVIELDHINFGVNKKTKELNKNPRTRFSVADIEKFLSLLNGEMIMAREHRGRRSRFEIRLDCPIKGQFQGKEFIAIFETDYDQPDTIHTITLYPGW